jgi:predicted amidohydrolase
MLYNRLHMKIALIQMSSKKDEIASNLAAMVDFIERAAHDHADLVVFPEMSLTGYFTSPKYLSSAISVEDIEVKKIVALSKTYGLTIIFGLSEKDGDRTYISQLVAQDDQLSGIYRKHNVLNEEAGIFTPGKSSPIFGLGKFKFGITICADIDLPELFEEYSKSGCDMVFECASPNLYGDRKNRDWEKGYAWWKIRCVEKIGQYALRNKMMIAVATQRGRDIDDDFPGGGYLFSQNGELLAETKDYRQEMLLVEI